MAVTTSAFDRVVTPLAQDFGRRYDDMPQEERERLSAQGEAEYERLRQEIKEERESPRRRRPPR